jgi:hypothetical protein
MDYKAKIDMLPEYMQEGMLAYIEHGREPGSFLEAILSNDLKNSFARADYTNVKQIGVYVQYLYSYAPSACWGSPEKYAAWVAHQGLEGKE